MEITINCRTDVGLETYRFNTDEPGKNITFECRSWRVVKNGHVVANIGPYAQGNKTSADIMRIIFVCEDGKPEGRCFTFYVPATPIGHGVHYYYFVLRWSRAWEGKVQESFGGA